MKMNMVKSVFTVGLGLSLLGVLPLQAQTVLPLNEARSELEVPDYQASERSLLAEKTLMTIRELFVHRDLKVRDFGQRHDPVPRLEALRREAADLTNNEFHDQIATIFLDLHDLHTNYVAPAPRSCGIAFIPLKFGSVDDGDGPRVLVSGKLRLGEEYVENVEKGMRLLSVNGTDVETHLKTIGDLSGGANPAAMRYRALQMLSMLGAQSHPLPKDDQITLTLQGDGDAFELTLPWLAFLDSDCLNQSPNPPGPVGDEAWRFYRPAWLMQMQMAQDHYQIAYQKLFGSASEGLMAQPERRVDDFQDRYNRLFGQPSDPIRDFRPRGDEEEAPWSEVFEYTILNTPAGKLGYVSLKTFYWENPSLDIATVVQAFRLALETELQEASALVIDVRGNPGGLIVFAEKLIQLFAPRGVEPTTVRMLANQLNEDIFRAANGGENRWSEAIQRATERGDRYMEPLAITPPAEANDMGQVWFKPVVVLTDAGCYSACDLFAAGMQDNGAARIIGVDTNTGAGGANVMEYKTFGAIMESASYNPFTALPYDQNFRVSWRQTLRAGLNEGELLENRGVVADSIVPLTAADLMMGESRQLMAEIHRQVDEQAPRYVSGLAPILGGEIYLANGDEANWQEKVHGIDTLEVKQGSRIVNSYDLAASNDATPVAVSATGFTGDWTDQQITLIGKLEGRQVFQVVRNLHWRGQYRDIGSNPIDHNFRDGMGPVHAINLKGQEESGWTVRNGILRVGEGPNYSSRVLTRAMVPVALAGRGARVTVDLAVTAESLNDTLRIYATNPATGQRLHIFAGSELPRSRNARFSLPRGWQKADLVFEFESDENWNLTGPEIRSLVIAR